MIHVIRVIGIAVLATVVGLALNPAPIVSADPTTEIAYLEGLDVLGVNYADVGVGYIVNLGYGICDNMHEGYGAVAIAKSMIRANWTSHDAWATMAAASNFFCPDTGASFSKQREAAIAAGLGTTAER